jgi:hypothetical protein
MLPMMETASSRINKSRLWLVFGLTAGYMVAEAATGLLTKSLALLADAGHMLTDAGALDYHSWPFGFLNGILRLREASATTGRKFWRRLSTPLFCS